MLAKQDEFINEASATIYQLSQEEQVRLQCEAREDYYRRQRTVQYNLNKQKDIIEKQNITIENQNAMIKQLADQTASQEAKITSQQEELTSLRKEIDTLRKLVTSTMRSEDPIK